MTQDWDTRLRVARLRAESVLLSYRYGAISFDQQDGTWLYVERFPIATGWNKSVVAILVDIPAGTPGYPQVATQWFWTDRDLMTNNHRSIEHFFANANSSYVNQEYYNKGWGHFCIHPKDWRPSPANRLTQGDSLITYLELISFVFRDKKSLVQ